MKSSTNFCCLRALDFAKLEFFSAPLLLFRCFTSRYSSIAPLRTGALCQISCMVGPEEVISDHLQSLRFEWMRSQSHWLNSTNAKKRNLRSLAFTISSFFFLCFCCRRSFLCLFLNYSFRLHFEAGALCSFLRVFREGFVKKIHVTWFNLSSLRHLRSVLDWAVMSSQVGSWWWNLNRVCTLSGATMPRRMLHYFPTLHTETMEARRRRKKGTQKKNLLLNKKKNKTTTTRWWWWGKRVSEDMERRRNKKYKLVLHVILDQ